MLPLQPLTRPVDLQAGAVDQNVQRIQAAVATDRRRAGFGRHVDGADDFSPICSGDPDHRAQ
ncbi:MAG: hypothetical protein QOD93_6175 [Acetobacteraceae bacterium]|nr:hypothetical protein [Acetobacteraceae bacterium]